MKKIVPLLLAACLVLSGCGKWMTGSYVSVTLHQEHRQQALSDTMSVSTLVEVESALASLVDERLESGTIVLENYDMDQADADLAAATAYILERYPMGAYAVSNLECTRNPEPTVVNITVEYRISKQQMDRVEQLNSEARVKTRLQALLADLGSSMTFQVKNLGDVDFSQWIQDYADENPNQVMTIPRLTLVYYPERGEEQIVELSLDYDYSREDMRSYQDLVQAEYRQAVRQVKRESDPLEKYNALFRFMEDRPDKRFESSVTPAYSLLHDNVGDSKAYALNFAAIGRLAELEIYTVVGSLYGEVHHWNICAIDDTYFHIDPYQLIRDGAEFTMRYDDEMEGYVWDYDAYPSCVQPTEPTEPEE